MEHTGKPLKRAMRQARRSLRHTADPTSLRQCGADSRAIRLALGKAMRAARSALEA